MRELTLGQLPERFHARVIRTAAWLCQDWLCTSMSSAVHQVVSELNTSSEWGLELTRPGRAELV